MAFLVCLHSGENLLLLAALAASWASGYAPFHVVFDAPSSSDPHGSTARHTWNFGDGGTARGVQVEHTFQDGGEYPVILTVEDDRGAEDSATVVIEVLNPSPLAKFTFRPIREWEKITGKRRVKRSRKQHMLYQLVK